jgi:hypothetical protein
MIYERLDTLLRERTLSGVPFEMRVTELPLKMHESQLRLYRDRHSVLKQYFEGVLDVLRRGLNGELSPAVSRLLLGDAPAHIGIEFHKGVVEALPAAPTYYRLDQPSPDKLAEIQCPGSFWGEYALLEDAYRVLGKYPDRSIADDFSMSLAKHLGSLPMIHHLADNTSRPTGTQYFIHRTRSGVKYYGWDAGIRARDCNFVRSHSVYGLVAENHFKERLQAAFKGVLKFDLPPNLVFDEKAALALPFWSETRRFFPDAVRNIIHYTAPLNTDGVQLANGDRISIQEFASRKKGDRAYYLKYAGSDVAINWGAKAVFRLGNDSRPTCEKRLRQALCDVEKGRPWVIQEEGAEEREITYLTRADGQNTDKSHVGYRAFYGPTGLLGIMVLFRKHFKVHGQAESVATIVEGV